jgi:hypothetical protein
LQAKESSQKKCALVLVVDGFEEREAIVFLSLLRQAGLCAKSVGLTSGLVSSAHGVLLMPDLTLSDLDHWADTPSIGAVVLPEGRQSLARLETDPRVHKLLRQVVAQDGQIVTSREGLRVPRAAGLWGDELEQVDNGPRVPVLLREPNQSPETLAQDLIRRLKQPPRT